MARPLDGVLVLDFTWVLSGPFATMLLADMGATVIKVEMPGSGDFTRTYSPFFGDVSHYFLSINRNKKSLTLNLKTGAGQELARKLAQKADVVVENFVPGTMAKFGLSYDDLKEINPRLVYASCSGFGQTGPYSDRPAFDVIVQAMAGTMSMTGEMDGPPVRVGFSAGDLGAALFMSNGILAALLERERSGLGQWIDVSMLDTQVALLENAFTRFFASGDVPTRLGSRHSVIVPFQAYETSDGQFVVGAGNQSQWADFCTALGMDHLKDDHRFSTATARAANVDALEAEVTARTRRMTTEGCLALLSNAKVPCAPVQTIDQVVDDPQLAFRGMFMEVEHKRLGKLRLVGSPIKMSRSDGCPSEPCPDLGEHTEEVLSSYLGLRQAEIDRLRTEGVV